MPDRRPDNSSIRRRLMRMPGDRQRGRPQIACGGGFTPDSFRGQTELPGQERRHAPVAAMGDNRMQITWRQTMTFSAIHHGMHHRVNGASGKSLPLHAEMDRTGFGLMQLD